MAKLLQSGHHDDSDYNRPNQVWLCGHLCEGRSCALGPDASGRCEGGAECLPLLNGDRWECSRPGHRGGPCDEGPLADGTCCRDLAMCSPQRSQRSLRMRVSLAMVGLTLGLLVVVFAGRRGDRDRIITAGPLSTAHASEGMSCDDCHDDSATHAALAGFNANLAKESAMSGNCLTCHANMAGEMRGMAGNAHGLSPATLASLQGEESATPSQPDLLLSWVSHGAIPQRGQDGALSCETCHTEHNGKHVSLSELNNRQCQICHQRQFESFSHGHPSFEETGYPYQRRTHLFFDHASHYGKHFTGEKSEFAPNRAAAPDASENNSAGILIESESCRTCHSIDQRGERMLVNGYQASCAACHEDAVRGGNHVPLLTLPSLPVSADVETDAAASADGRWPSVTDGSYPLTPLMVALLPDDVRAEAEKLEFEVIDSTETGNRYLSLEEGNTTEVASAIQQVCDEVWKEGPVALERRLEANGWPMNVEEAGEDEGSLFAGLSIDTMRSFLFPGYEMSLFELSFPALDRESLDGFLLSQSRSTGAWPRRAVGPISPLLRLLLEQNPKARTALEVLDGSEVSLDDLSAASAPVMMAAEDLAWQIKWLFASAKAGEGADLIRRLQPLEGGILNRMSDADLLKRVFKTARKDEVMSADFDDEFARYQSGVYPKASVPEPDVEPPKPKGGGDDDFGDAKADDDFGDAKADDEFGEEKSKPADDDFGSDPAPAKPTAEPATDDDDFGDDKGGDDDFGAGDKAATPADAEKAPQKALSEPSNPGEWQSNGGWFFDSEGRFALSYVSRGHADPVLKRWLNMLAAASSSENERVREDAQLVLGSAFGFRDGVKTSSSGKCLKCHTVDVVAREKQSPLYQVNWYGGFARTGDVVQLTHFNHRKHSFAISCIECHQFDTAAKTAEDSSQSDSSGLQYADFFPTANALRPRGNLAALLKANDPHHYHSNFQAMDHQASCARCHQEQLAGNSCLQCHSYHHRPRGVR